ncbi:FBP domain-containing protein [Streptomyces sp. M10(2022)]
MRNSFVNCSKGEAKRIGLPRDLSELPWGDLDFLGWRDRARPPAPTWCGRAPRRARSRSGSRCGSRRRAAEPSAQQPVLGLRDRAFGWRVDLLAAPLAGAAGRQGNTVALYMCADLACSLYVRGKKPTALARRLEETLTLEEQIARTLRNLDAFLAKVTAA